MSEHAQGFELSRSSGPHRPRGTAEPTPDQRIARSASRAALVGMIGVVLSGPPGVFGMGLLSPQPQWAGVEGFVQHFHRMQTLPYAAGILLVGGFLMLVAQLHQLAPSLKRGSTSAALVFAAIGGAFIFFNYVSQTTYVPALVEASDRSRWPEIATFSMANPVSLVWSLEMWGYGFLGVASWLTASVFDGPGVERAARVLFRANGIASVLGALLAMADLSRLLSLPGLVVYLLWNVLFFVMLSATWVALRRRASPSATRRARVPPPLQ